MLDNIHEILPNLIPNTNLLLEGSTDLDEKTNTAILNSTMNYIKETNRFE